MLQLYLLYIQAITKMEKKNKKSFYAVLRNYFLTGVIVLIPIGFTLYLTKILIGITSDIVPENINPNSYLPFNTYYLLFKFNNLYYYNWWIILIFLG